MRRTFLLASILLLLCAAPASGAGTPAIGAIPGSRLANYATPVVIAQPGDEISFINTDVFVHDVRSVEMGPDDTPWCNPADPDQRAHKVRNPRRFPKGKCPLLWTPPISITNGAYQVEVYGTENLEAGTTVEFYCTIHPDMQGQVIVL